MQGREWEDDSLYMDLCQGFDGGTGEHASLLFSKTNCYTEKNSFNLRSADPWFPLIISKVIKKMTSSD